MELNFIRFTFIFSIILYCVSNTLCMRSIKDLFHYGFSHKANLADTGYWNFLLIGGLYPRLLHYLITEPSAYGHAFVFLDQKFGHEYGKNTYKNIERKVVLQLPIAKLILKLQKLRKKLKTIKVAGTDITLGDAFTTLQNFQENPKLVDEFVKTLGMVDDLNKIFKNPSSFHDQKLEHVKELILENPKAFNTLMEDPQIISVVSGSILQSIQNVNFVNTIESLQTVFTKLQSEYPNTFKERIDTLLDVEDDNSNTLRQSLQTTAQLLTSSDFVDRVQQVLDDDALRNLHIEAQTVLPKVLKEHFTPFLQKSGVSKAALNNLMKVLAFLGAEVSEEQAKDIISFSQREDMPEQVEGFFKELKENGDSSTSGIANLLRARGFNVGEDVIENLQNDLQLFSSEQMSKFINKFDVKISPEVIEKLKSEFTKIISKPNPDTEKRDEDEADEVEVDKQRSVYESEEGKLEDADDAEPAVDERTEEEVSKDDVCVEDEGVEERKSEDVGDVELAVDEGNEEQMQVNQKNSSLQEETREPKILIS